MDIIIFNCRIYYSLLLTQEGLTMSNIKVNWYDEELDKFYETDKDNNGYVHGIYLYYGNEPFDYECKWFKTEQERDKEFNKLQREGLI